MAERISKSMEEEDPLVGDQKKQQKKLHLMKKRKTRKRVGTSKEIVI